MQHFVKDHGEQYYHEHVGQGVDDVDYAHHNKVDLAAEIPRDTAVEHADYQDYDRREEAYEEGYPRRIDHADEIVAALLVCAEYVREAAAALVDELLLELAVLERGQVLRALVPHAVYGEHLLVFIGHDERSYDYHEQYESKEHEADDCERVPEELAHAVLEEGRAFAHYVLLALFFLGSGSKAFLSEP